MTYREALRYLNTLGNEVLTMRFGLESVRALLSELGNPHESFRSILVAGTNGKGSVATFLHSILTEGGYRSGLYTSPHVISLDERVVIGDTSVLRRELSRALTEVRRIVDKGHLPCPPTYFETLTAAAFWCLARSGVEIAVLEVGMGGRLDSTNVVDPLLTVLTPIGLDHQRHLGHSLLEIAGEKAGTIRAGQPVISARQDPAVHAFLSELVASKGCAFDEVLLDSVEQSDSVDGFYGFAFEETPISVPVPGKHQAENALLAIRSAKALVDQGIAVTREAIRDGIERAEIHGRIEKIDESPATYVDGAHNPQAARRLAEFVAEHTSAPRSLLIAMLEDKDIESVGRILGPLFEAVYPVRIRSVRAAPPSRVAGAFQGARLPAPFPNAIRSARRDSATVVVAGSFRLVREAIKTRLRVAV